MATQPLWLKRHGFVSLLLLRALVKYELKNPKNAKAEESFIYTVTTVVCVLLKNALGIKECLVSITKE